MKLEVDEEQFASIHKQIRCDEAEGIDPGAYWAGIFPGVAEIEFVVVPTFSAHGSRT